MERELQATQTTDKPQAEQGQRTRTTVRVVRIPEAITVANFAEVLKVSPIDLMKQLMRAGIMANINQAVDFDTAAALAPLFGYKVAPLEKKAKKSTVVEEAEEDASVLEGRSPVVTILGHVDHGKTTLLDNIRKTRVVEREAGGITQHIGAYQAEYNNRIVTFLDTPGHEAFTAMRARGAEVTDIAILVVAADDGIMPQTVEAIDHAKAAKVPIVVAINKIDRPNADLDRVKRQLSENNLLIEEWGGDVIAVPVSAVTGEGVDDLLENILVVSEISDFKANPSRSARGVVLEAKLDKSRGPVATLLVKNGTLNVGDILVVGSITGRIKALVDSAGKRIRSAGPSTPVEVLGLNEPPAAGDTFRVARNEREARTAAELAQRQQESRRQVSLEDIMSRIRTGETKELNLVLKADVQGSIEAIREGILQLSTDETQVRIIHAASGSITESDVFLALASEGIVIGFNTTIQQSARQVADAENVEVRFYSIIYQLLDDVQSTIKGMAAPMVREVVDGHATVRAVFSRGRTSKIAGIYVTDGRVVRNSSARLARKGSVIFDGSISSLRHFKDDVRELATGYEGGVMLNGFNDFQEEDTLEFHRQEQVS